MQLRNLPNVINDWQGENLTFLSFRGIWAQIETGLFPKYARRVSWPRANRSVQMLQRWERLHGSEWVMRTIPWWANACMLKLSFFQEEELQEVMAEEHTECSNYGSHVRICPSNLNPSRISSDSFWECLTLINSMCKEGKGRHRPCSK